MHTVQQKATKVDRDWSTCPVKRDRGTGFFHLGDKLDLGALIVVLSSTCGKKIETGSSQWCLVGG